MARLEGAPMHDAPAQRSALLARQVHGVPAARAAGTATGSRAGHGRGAAVRAARQDGSPCGRCPGCTLVAAVTTRIFDRPTRGACPSRLAHCPGTGEEPAKAPRPARRRSRARERGSGRQIRDLSEWITLSTHAAGASDRGRAGESMNTPRQPLRKSGGARREPCSAGQPRSTNAATLRSRCALLRVRLPAPASRLAGSSSKASDSRSSADRGGRCPARGGAGRAPDRPDCGDRLLAARKGAGWRRRRWSTVPRERSVAGSSLCGVRRLLLEQPSAMAAPAGAPEQSAAERSVGSVRPTRWLTAGTGFAPAAPPGLSAARWTPAYSSTRPARHDHSRPPRGCSAYPFRKVADLLDPDPTARAALASAGAPAEAPSAGSSPGCLDNARVGLDSASGRTIRRSGGYRPRPA